MFVCTLVILGMPVAFRNTTTATLINDGSNTIYHCPAVTSGVDPGAGVRARPNPRMAIAVSIVMTGRG